MNERSRVRLWITLWNRWGNGGQRGSVTVLMAAYLVLAGALVVALSRLGGDAVDRAQARTAADAAALAGASDGREAAETLARVNGGRLLEYEVDDNDVEVRVEVGGAQGRARARRLVLSRPEPTPDQLYTPPKRK